jgi:UDPglucose--hexose-1-phosphate uridylyltransferase
LASQDFFQKPHRRYNPLSGEHVLVSPQRAQRPWQGQIEKSSNVSLPQYDPICYLCPGNERAGGVKNPAYSTTYAFSNDFPSLLNETSRPSETTGLFAAQSLRGANRVICFNPRHDLTLATMTAAEIEVAIQSWVDETAQLGKQFSWVQLFQNQGEMMGASNPHPHCQVWAQDQIPQIPEKEDASQRTYRDAKDGNLILDYLEQELISDDRLIVETNHWLAVVPFWAVWPFETFIAPKRHVLRLTDLIEEERKDLAGLLKQLFVKYDNLFEAPFPYSMGWHGAPFTDASNDHWQLHAHIYPPLLRSASVRKFMVGYELLAEPQRDLTPEQAAQRLVAQPAIHYSQR